MKIGHSYFLYFSLPRKKKVVFFFLVKIINVVFKYGLFTNSFRTFIYLYLGKSKVLQYFALTAFNRIVKGTNHIGL